MKKIIFILLLLPFACLSQPASPPAGTYTPVSGGFNWGRGYFRSLNLPSVTTRTIAPGQWPAAGGIIYDSLQRAAYLNIGHNTWVRLTDTTATGFTGTPTKLAFYAPSTGVINSAENIFYKASPANRQSFPSLTSTNEGTITLNAQNYSELGIVTKLADFGAVSNDIYNLYETGVNPVGSVTNYAAASASLTVACVNSTNGVNAILFAGFKGNSTADSAAALLYNGKGINFASNGNSGYIRFGGGYNSLEYGRFAASTGYLGLGVVSPSYRLHVDDPVKVSGVIVDRSEEFGGPNIKTSAEYLTITGGMGVNIQTRNLTQFQAAINDHPVELRFMGGNGGSMSHGVGVINGFNYDGPEARKQQNLFIITSGFNAISTHKGGSIVFIPGTDYVRSSRDYLFAQYTGDSVNIYLNTSTSFRPYFYVRGREHLTDSLKLDNIAYYTSNIHGLYNDRVLVDKGYVDSIVTVGGGGVTDHDLLNNLDWTNTGHFSLVHNSIAGFDNTGQAAEYTGASPISLSSNQINIANAAADGSTKGAASFTANDFNSSSGNISIDYTNGQAASASNKGFLTTTDWSTFNGKANAALDNLASVAINATLIPGSSGAIDLGSTSKQWGNVFLKEGAVQNYDNGDATMTQTQDTITWAGITNWRTPKIDIRGNGTDAQFYNDESRTGASTGIQFYTETSPGSGTSSGQIGFRAGSLGMDIKKIGGGAATELNIVYGGNNAFIDMGSNLSIYGSAGQTGIGAGGTQNYLVIASGGGVTLSNLSGTGSRVVVADAAGALTSTLGIAASTFTPTLTSVTNVASSSVTSNAGHYIRIGNEVSYSITFTVTPTAGTSLTQIAFSLPVSSNLASTIDLAGEAAVVGSTYNVGTVQGDNINDRGQVEFTSSNTSAHTVLVTGHYIIK